MSAVEVSHGFDCPADDETVVWDSRVVSRDEAARLIREARRQGWPVSISMKGFGIYAGANPGWAYGARYPS